jgi:hypothetical protein
LNLETELRALPIDWPPTPPLELVLERRRRRPRWPVVAALAAAGVAAAFAVPQSRGAILRFLHLRGASIEFVSTLPPAEERPLGADLGGVVPAAVARGVVSRLLLPAIDPVPPIHLAPGDVVSVVFEERGHPVLLSELRGGGGVYLKKLASFGTSAEPARVGRDVAVWVTGARHVVTYPRRPARFAGDVLLWEHGDTTYRLEGPGLTRSGAIELAQSLRKG